MLFTTPSQFAVLALCVLAGFIFGLAARSGGKTKARLRAVEAEHAAYRRDAEARIAAAEADRDRAVRSTPVAAPVSGVRAQNEARPAGHI